LTTPDDVDIDIDITGDIDVTGDDTNIGFSGQLVRTSVIDRDGIRAER
jgi:hypothetical protein